MDLHFRFAGEEEVKAFHELRVPGAQGSMTIPAWQLHVEQLYSCVQHLTDVNPCTPFQVFLDGLNNGALRERGYKYWDDHRDTVTLSTLAQELARHAATLQQRQLTERTAQVYGVPGSQQLGFPQGGSSSAGSNLLMLSTQGAAGSGDTSSAHTYHKDLTDVEVLDRLQTRHPGEATKVAALLQMLKRGRKNPGAPSSFCKLPEHSLSSSVRWHSNADCQKQQKAQQQSQRQQQQQSDGDRALQQAQQLLQQMNLTQTHQAMAAQAAAATPPTPASDSASAQLQLQNLQLQGLQQQLSAFMAQQQQRANMPNQVPKSTQEGSSKGRRTFSNSAPRVPCSLCGWQDGHPPNGPGCYCANPEAAYKNNPDWGPSASTAPTGVLTYIEACMGRSPPLHLNLSKVTHIVAQLQQQGKLSPAMQQFIQQQMLARAQQQATGMLAAFPAPQPTQFAMLPQPVAGTAAPAAAAAYTVHVPSSSGASQQQTAAGSSSSYNWYAAASIVVPPGYSNLPLAPPAAGMGHAMAATRSQGRAKINELAPFLPKANVAAPPPEGNTAAGGRHAGSLADAAAVPAPLSQEPLAQQLQSRDLLQLMHALLELLAKQQEVQQREHAAMAAAASCSTSSCMTAANAPCIAAASGIMRTAAAAGSGSSSSRGVVSKGSVAQALHTQPLFAVHDLDYNDHMSRRACLYKIVDMAPGEPAYVELSYSSLPGQPAVPHVVHNTAVDNGCNQPLIPEEYANAVGIPWKRCPSPQLMHSDGQPHDTIIGQTEPITLTIGPHTQRPLKVTRRFSIIRGNAGGMFNLCLDSETFKGWFAHVNPLFRHFCWYPDAPHDYSKVNGVPVDVSYPKTVFLPAVSAVGTTAQLSSSAVPHAVVAAAAQLVACQPHAEELYRHADHSPAQHPAAGSSVDKQQHAAAAERISHAAGGSSTDPQTTDSAPTAQEAANSAPNQDNERCGSTKRRNKQAQCKKKKKTNKGRHSKPHSSSTAAAAATGSAPAQQRTRAPARPPPLHYLSSAFALLLCLVVGLAHYCINVPMLGYPGKALSWLVASAQAPLWRPSCSSQALLQQRIEPSTQPPEPPPGGTPAGSPCRKRRHSRARHGTRDRRLAGQRRLWSKLKEVERAAADRINWCALRPSLAVFSNRVILFSLLLLGSFTLSASAMQVGSLYSSAPGALSNGLQQVHLGSVAPPPLSQQALQLLGAELGAVRRSCFRSSCWPAA
jgi:hypothetical protein